MLERKTDSERWQWATEPTPQAEGLTPRPSERTQAQGRASPGAMLSPEDLSDEEAKRILDSLELNSDRRGVFAERIFPYRPGFGSHGEWRKTVGSWVANDIKTDPYLRQRMFNLGCVARKTGYSHEMLLTLVKYYYYKGIIKPLA